MTKRRPTCLSLAWYCACVWTNFGAVQHVQLRQILMDNLSDLIARCIDTHCQQWPERGNHRLMIVSDDDVSRYHSQFAVQGQCSLSRHWEVCWTRTVSTLGNGNWCVQAAFGGCSFSGMVVTAAMARETGDGNSNNSAKKICARCIIVACGSISLIQINFPKDSMN